MTRVLAALLAVAVATSVAACSAPTAPAATGPTGATGAQASASASSTVSGTAVTVTGAWARAASKGMGSAAYFTIAAGPEGDALVAASTTAATEAQIHETSTDAQGMTGMHPVESVPVPAGGQVEFDPGGYHVMLNELTQDLRAGDTFELVLTFEGAGDVTGPVEVRTN